MGMAKVAITLDNDLLKDVDRAVRRKIFPNRSRMIQEAVAEKLEHLSKRRLSKECMKLDLKYEQALADEGISEGADPWPEY